MKRKQGVRFAIIAALGIMTLAGSSLSSLSNAQSPYTTQVNSPIRGLSTQEVDDLLNGRGAGYARTAELNSSPGPRHVLDLKQELALSPEQEQRLEVIFRQMNTEAKQVGQDIVRLEQQLSNAFNQRTISESEIEEQTQQLATLYGQYRAIHLKPHVEVQRLLSAEQVAKYNELRGYSAPSVQLAPNLPVYHP
jgi:Spy/CpxP family protein refolding chaperone